MVSECSIVLRANWFGLYKNTPLGNIPIVTTNQPFPRFRNNGFGTWKTTDYTLIECTGLSTADRQIDWKSSRVNQAGGYEGYLILEGPSGESRKIFVTPTEYDYKANTYTGHRYTFTSA